MKVDERFLKYVEFATTSDESSETIPSTPGQRVLGEYLAKELTEIGLEGAKIDEYGYVYAWLPASEGYEDADPIGFVAHMDTSDAVPGENIKPRYIDYEGGDIVLGNGAVTDVKSFPFLKNYEGQKLIVTDGSTLLGADDKAGIAEIFTAMEYLIAHPEIKHGRICVAVTPDEEIGRGPDKFNVLAFGAKYGYTLDGGTLGEIEYENFNAASARLTVNGVSIHPGSAKDKMKNAVLIMSEMISMLPPSEVPAHTEGYEGFYHVGSIEGGVTKCVMSLIIRDHDAIKFEERKTFLKRLAAYINSKYGEGTAELEIKDSYRNMKEMILPVMHIIDKAKAAFEDCGVVHKCVPIRGGTDGATLSFMGMPCPNLSTGGENFHGINEFVSVPAMEKMVQVVVALCKINPFDV